MTSKLDLHIKKYNKNQNQSHIAVMCFLIEHHLKKNGKSEMAIRHNEQLDNYGKRNTIGGVYDPLLICEYSPGYCNHNCLVLVLLSSLIFKHTYR